MNITTAFDENICTITLEGSIDALSSQELTQAVNVMFILPPPFVLPVFADDPERRVYVSSALSLSTLVAIAGFAVLAAVG